MRQNLYCCRTQICSLGRRVILAFFNGLSSVHSATIYPLLWQFQQTGMTFSVGNQRQRVPFDDSISNKATCYSTRNEKFVIWVIIFIPMISFFISASIWVCWFSEQSVHINKRFDSIILNSHIRNMQTILWAAIINQIIICVRNTLNKVHCKSYQKNKEIKRQVLKKS